MSLYEDWINFTKTDEKNKEFLEYLVSLRNNDVDNDALLEAYQNAGIIGSPTPDGEFFLEFLNSIGYTVEDLGYDERSIKLLGDGFIIPSWSISKGFLFCVNHNKNRQNKNLGKYVNVYPLGKKEVLSNYRFYGLENTVKALELGYICLCEGIFDKLRLESVGLPAMTTLGSEISSMQIRILNRFNYIKLIGDNDSAGKKSQQQIMKGVPLTQQFIIPYEKDIDDLAKNKPDIFKEFIEKVKK